MLPLAGAAVLLHPAWRSRLVAHGLALSDAIVGADVQSAASPRRRLPTREVTPFDRFPLNSYLVHDPEIDLDEWRLEVSGLVARPGEYTLDAICARCRACGRTRGTSASKAGMSSAALAACGSPICWRWSAPIRAHAFLEVTCADDYYESLDMATARHPQSLLCDEMYGRPLTREHGAPLRLVLPTKLGYKQAKYIVGLRVSDVLGAKRGYWVDQGYSWYGGL